MSEQADSQASAGPELGPLARMIGVFFSPAKTFESINRKPGWDWCVPVLVIMAAVFTFQSAAVPKIDVDEAVAQQLRIAEKFGSGEMSAEQREKVEEQIREGIEKQSSPLRRLLTLPFVLIGVLLVPAIYHGIAAAVDRKSTYWRMVSAYSYTGLIYVVPTLLSSAVAWSSERLSANDVQYNRVLKSNVAAFLDFDTTHKAILAVLSSVDLFDAWGFAVGVIAVSRVTRLSVRGAALTVGGVWGAYILLKVVLGVVAQAFIPA